jgi:3-deoxy-D-manno-octulosonate 8-phosphate phosphatase (KDO 8-P phosphatase)
VTIDARVQERAKSVRLIVMDVDGVLTDGRIVYGAAGDELKSFSVKDGLGLRAAHRAGLVTAILTSRSSGAVARRAAELGISEIHQGVAEKVGTYESLLERYGVTDEAVAYLGDDLNDLPLLARAGLSAAPADAAEEVKSRVSYVAARAGGHGMVREVIELILKAQGKWHGIIQEHHHSEERGACS